MLQTVLVWQNQRAGGGAVGTDIVTMDMTRPCSWFGAWGEGLLVTLLYAFISAALVM